MLELFALTVTVAVAECTSDPVVPVTVSVKVEGVTEGPTATFSVEDTEPALGGVTGFVVNDADTPAGGDDTLRVTGELNPLSELTVTVVEADSPVLTVMGEMGLREKSAGGGANRNRYAAMLPITALPL
jgi:hypothetical protein